MILAGSTRVIKISEVYASTITIIALLSFKSLLSNSASKMNKPFPDRLLRFKNTRTIVIFTQFTRFDISPYGPNTKMPAMNTLNRQGMLHNKTRRSFFKPGIATPESRNVRID